VTFSSLGDILACRCESSSTAQPPLLDALLRLSKRQALGTSDRSTGRHRNWGESSNRLCNTNKTYNTSCRIPGYQQGLSAKMYLRLVRNCERVECHACDLKRLAHSSHSTCSTHQIFHHGYTVCLFLGVMRPISSCRNAFELRDCDTSDLVRCWRKVPITRCPGRNTSLLPHLHDAYLVNIASWRHAPISAPRMSSSS